MKIHAIQTGTVQVHERQRSGAGRGLMRFANTLLDRTWSPPLPIYAWVVEHPEGLLVVDTGETARAADPGYFPRWHPYFRMGVREQVWPEDEVGPGMRALGLDPADVRWVVMTHLHTDHAGGLSHFPDAEILVSKEEFAEARGLAGRLRGYLPNRWPAAFDPTLVPFRPKAFGPFPWSYSLTRSRDVHLIPTPGHTRGHLSVAVELGHRIIFFAGDTSYTETNMRHGVVDGVASLGGGEGTAAKTLGRIRSLAAERSVVYLPSHDPQSGRRLVAAVEKASVVQGERLRGVRDAVSVVSLRETLP
jgi:glyoxylase-like metal-dependent hydrolase (beta-lactamase superfamily II)